MNDQKNLILAIALSVFIMLGFQFFMEGPRVEREMALQQQQAAQQSAPAGQSAPESPATSTGAPIVPSVPDSGSTAPPMPSASPAPAAAAEASAVNTPRLTVETPRLKGSIALLGARIDQLTLTDYRVNVDPESPPIVLFSPPGSQSPYYAQFGWVASEANVSVPGPNTVWRADRERLTPDSPVTLTWDNGQGQRFVRKLAIDADYMFTVTDSVENRGATPVTLYAYGLIARTGTPKTEGFYLLHEGPVGVFNGRLQEPSYDDLRSKTESAQTTGGWLGITDKYWLAALIPDQKSKAYVNFRHTRANNVDTYQADWASEKVAVAPGASTETTSRLFGGAKEINLLDRYTDSLAIDRLDLAIDFGWFWFLTKPFFYVLAWFNHLLGNYGLAILAVTVLVKLLFFPLANKSYASMSAMKKLQPEMLKLRERYKDDRMKLNEEMMALYKRSKVNPAAGCLPIVVQIPVFFALYKVLFISIEMRHAPFYGWIRDLSAADPTNLFNLFGIVPFDPTTLPVIGAFLHLGVWPIIMGVTMWAQMRLNPTPPDPIQQKIFALMPILFTFMLASFPAGLVIYWAWNNLLSIAQQLVIMKRMGVKIGS